MVASNKLGRFALLVRQYDRYGRRLSTKLKNTCHDPSIGGQYRSGRRAGRDQLLIDDLAAAKRLDLNNAVLRIIGRSLKSLLFQFVQRRVIRWSDSRSERTTEDQHEMGEQGSKVEHGYESIPVHVGLANRKNQPD